jgi:hypothetical protein
MIRNRIVPVCIVIFTLSLGLAWVSTGFESFRGWGSFLAVMILGGGILLGGWLALRKESVPQWVGRLMVGTMILRLGVGIIWFIVLPLWGHGTEGELAGYVMSDAYRRDTTAWTLAQSEKSLFSAFTDYRLADQYGGLLFFSSAIYRYLGGGTHIPLLIVVLTASFSALSILFTWIFTRRVWGEQVAKIASWVLFIYPEAVLFGSSQMREAFVMSLVGMALFGLVLYWQDRKWQGIAWMVGALLISLPISLLFAVMLLGILIAMVLVVNQGQVLKNWILWGVLGGLLLVGVIGIWLLGDRLYPEGASNPWELINHWLVFAARWEVRTTAISSGWFGKILARSPEWMHIWIVLGYGTVQPFLPAALIATGNWTWRLIAIWRAFGWTFLLGLLLVAPFRAGRKIKQAYIAAGVSLIVWLGILLSAYRGGGDQWDNPRYRVAFIVLQASLAAWVWVEQKRSPDPWLRRFLVGLGLVFAWFVPWYLRRYIANFTWPVIDLFKTLGLGFVSAVLYWVWDWARGVEKIPTDISNG